jgi:hypothetical protein
VSSRSLARLPTVAVAGALVVAAGCLGGAPPTGPSPTDTPTSPDAGASLTAETVTLSPGETDTLTARATEVGELWISARPPDERVTVDVANATLSPRPDRIVETFPPYWVYDPIEPTVRLRVPVSAAPDAPAGEYEVGVIVLNRTDHAHERGVEVRVPVVVESDGDGGQARE